MDTTHVLTSSPPPESYVVRIYRRDSRLPGCIIGTVERVADGSEVKFKGLRELAQILTLQGPTHAR